jgi:putative ABC transport system ATP-binding protein
MTDFAPLIELQHLSKRYQMDGVVVKALDDITLNIFPRDLITIVGSSGSGKSTLLHILGLLDKPTGGKVVFLGQDVNSFSEDRLAKLRNRAIGFVFQQFNLLPRTSALDNVLLPVWYNPDLDFPQAKKRARELLKSFGMADRMSHFPNQLSGGEQQRVAIARALICDPKLILADEPTGNLDSKTGKEIIDLLVDLNRRHNKTVVIVTHDPDIAKLGRRRVYLSDGKVVKRIDYQKQQ